MNYPSRISERGNCIFVGVVFSRHLVCYANSSSANECEKSDFVY